MKTTVSIYDFKKAFKDCGRDTNFSYEGLDVLFDWLEEYESDTGTEYELDVIGLCCEYIEMTPQEIISDWNLEIDPAAEDVLDQVCEFIDDETMLVGVTPQGTIVFQNY